MELIRKDVLKLALPIVLEQFFVMSLGMVNTMIASNKGKEVVSAIGMVDSISNIFIAFFSALAVGGTVVVAYYAGQEKMKEANEAAKQALFSGLAVSIGITLLIWVFRFPVIGLLFGSAEKTVIENSVIYLAITLLSYPLISFTSMAFGVLRGVGDTRTPMKITIIMNVFNAVMSYLLIYGLNIKFYSGRIYFPGFGVAGAAIAISLARTAGAALASFALVRGTARIRLSGLKSFKIHMPMQKSIYGIGIPAGIESLMFNGGKLITQVFVVGMGTVSIASNSIGGSIFGIINIPGSALSIAATTLVGQEMGRGDSDGAKNTLVYLTKLSMVSLAAVCALAFPLARGFSSLYSRDAAIIELTARLVWLSAVAMPILWPLSFVLPAGLKGAGDTRYTMVTAIIGMWAFRIVLGYILGVTAGMGVVGVWLGMFVDWLVRGVLYAARLKGGKWKLNAVVYESPGCMAESGIAAR